MAEKILLTAGLRSLLAEIRHATSEVKRKDSSIYKYIMSQYRKYQITDLQHCKAQEEMQFLAQTYSCYLKSVRKQNELHELYRGKGEMSIGETANLVGFKLPHDPK